jgi:RNA polymerase sigma-70 factor (ECF subfamily)
MKEKININQYLIDMKSGNMEAFATVYLLTKNQVYSVCLSVLKDRGLAEDAMQSTYVRIREKINYYTIGSNGFAWVLTIARNISINIYNRNSRVQTTDFSENEYLNPTNDDTKLEDMPIFNIAKRILNAEELEILTLYVVSGYKHREIAEMLDKPLGSVLWSYNNSIKKLKKEIKDMEV